MTPIRKYLSLLLALNLLYVISLAQPTNGLVAHWNMNGNANDVSGNGHNGTMFNVGTTTGQNGIPNGALLFNGSSSYINVPYQTDLNLTSYTMCAVVKPMGFYQGLCQGNFIMYKGVQSQPGGYGMAFYDNCYNSCGVLDTNLHVFETEYGGAPAPATAWQQPVKVHTNNWYCVVSTFNGATYKMYINGVLTATVVTQLGTMGNSATPLTFGYYASGGSAYPYWYNGAIDDFCLYNRVLADTEITAYCGLVAKPDTIAYISQQLNKTSFCPGDTVHVPYSVTSNFNVGNVFAAELSNATGNFTSPVAIGSVTSVTGGTIICTIPPGTPPGTGYRIRISSTNPAKYSNDNGVNLTVNAIPVVTITPQNKTICVGDSINLTASGATTYNWSPATGLNSAIGTTVTAKPAASATYTVTGVANQCRDSDTVHITVVPLPVLTISPKTATICPGQTVTVTAGGAIFYSWSPVTGLTPVSGPLVHAHPLVSTTYIVTAKDGNQCTAVDSVVITVSPGLPITITPKPVIICEGDSVILTADGATSFKWSPATDLNKTTGASVIAKPLNSITYIVTGTNEDQCSGKDNVTVNVARKASVNDSARMCIGGSLVYNGKTITAGGSYKFSYKTVFGCDSTVTLKVIPVPLPEAGFSFEISAVNAPVQFTDTSTGAASYNWSFGDGSTGTEKDPGHMYTRTATYKVCLAIANADGCTDTACNDVKVDIRPMIDVPTAFSPNGDGHNDVLYVRGAAVAGMHLRIYNRWGQMVFETKDMSVGWDGSFKGAQQETDVVAYVLDAVFVNGTTYKQSGNITVFH